MNKILFMGTPDFSVPVLEGLIENYEVIGVVTQPDKRVGRHQVLTPSPVKEVALKHHIPVFQPVKVRNEYEDFLALKPDIIVTCAYGQILPKTILDAPRLGCINVHASLLPKLRGGAPIQKSIIDGYDETGITIMYMDVSMDSGDIIEQSTTKILDSDNLESLYNRLKVMGRDLLLEVLPSIFDGTNQRIKQDESLVTYAYNITREEEYLDFTKDARSLFNQIRGLSPTPGAYFLLDGVEMKVYSSYISSDQSTGKVGTVSKIYKDGFGINTKDYVLVITNIKPFGKKRMDASSYLNGISKKDFIGKELNS